MSDVTRILGQMDSGEPAVVEELLGAVYSELKSMARRRLSEEVAGHSLQATALVHEAWLQLCAGKVDGWERRAHFFSAAAEAMRRILIDRARARGRLKRGGGWKKVNLTSVNLAVDRVPDEVLDLDDALTALALDHPKKAELVKLRFFAGLDMRQAAGLIDVSLATAERYWCYARAFLFDWMTREHGPPSG